MNVRNTIKRQKKNSELAARLRTSFVLTHMIILSLLGIMSTQLPAAKFLVLLVLILVTLSLCIPAWFGVYKALNQ